MKRKFLFIVLVPIVFIFLLASAAKTTSAFAYDKDNNQFDSELVVKSLLGNKKIKTIEYLYGLDESADYVYYEFADYGYAVFYKDTMEMMEYSPSGSLPFDNSRERHYYAGPSNSYKKKGEKFVNVYTGEQLSLSKKEAISFSKKTAKILSERTDAKKEYVVIEKHSDEENVFINKSGKHIFASPPINKDDLEEAYNSNIYGTTYIPNASYFTSHPTYGFNLHGTCGSVAAQLLLSYNNFYNDRRIIDPQYLCGGWNNNTGNNNIYDPLNYEEPNNNPYACFDPLKTDMGAGGSKSGDDVFNLILGEYRYNIYPDGYYYYVISNIEPDALSCVCTVIKYVINTDGTTTITTYSVNNANGVTSVESIIIRPTEEGDRDLPTEEYHTHDGAYIYEIEAGLRNMLGARLSNDQYTIESMQNNHSYVNSDQIKAQINEGRPLIISLSEDLGGVNHAVVGYGYQDYTYPEVSGYAGQTYSGYVVHMGWGRDSCRTWINETWCNAYITLELKHVHNYIDSPYSEHEMICSECGHRNVRFLYETVGNEVKITGVKNSNDSYSSVTIPTKINGKYVTQIDSLTSMLGIGYWKSIVLPKTITIIGNGAFSGLNRLEKLYLTSSTNLVSFEAQNLSYSNYYYTEHCLNVNLEPDTIYTLSFKYTGLHSTGNITDVFTSLGVGNSYFQWDLPFTKNYTGSDGTQIMTFIPTAEQLSNSNKLWCRFIRTGTPQTVSVYIKNVILEKGITGIAIDAFRGCDRLVSPGLHFDDGEGMSSIVSQEIGVCNSNVIFIPYQLYNGHVITEIAASGFANNKNIKWVFMQQGLEVIGNRAFQYCSNLLKIDMCQTSVTEINEYTFDICEKCHDPNHVHNPHSSFNGYCSLSKITYPVGLTTIKEGAFIRTDIPDNSLLPNTVTSIGAYAFYDSKMQIFHFPTSLTSLGAYALSCCGSVTVSDFESLNLTTIEEGTFELTDLIGVHYLPASITTIKKEAFYGSGFSSGFHFLGNNAIQTIEQDAFYSCGLKSIVLKNTITTIGSGAFGGNNSLTIYAQNSYQPNGWHANWNPSNRPVFWGCVLSSDNSYVLSFKKQASNIQYATSSISDPYRDGKTFVEWNTDAEGNGTSYSSANIASAPNNTTLYTIWRNKSCVAEGTLVTLADGTQVAVEDLTGDENLLVWNMLTGEYDSAPILFIDSDPSMTYEIIELTFSDGTEVKVIDEHAFFDMTLGEYVFLRNDASQYIGHYFNKQSANGAWESVQLVSVDVYDEVTTAWSPVTYGYLCYYVNGMLSMPGATEGFINIFDVDTTLMQYDTAQMEADIQTYGLYTYEEFNAVIPLPELVFDAFCGQYLKVSVGKGLITLQEIAALLERYSGFFE